MKLDLKALKDRLPKRSSEPKQYRHPIMRSLHGQKLCVDFKMVDEDHYVTDEYWRPLHERTLIGWGYLPAQGYKTELAHIFTKVYVKFDGFEMYPCLRMAPDGKVVDVSTMETASTLYDYFTSKAEQDFMEGMRARASGTLNNKMLIVVAVAVIGLIIGGYLFSH